jgi:hypothetical protein
VDDDPALLARLDRINALDRRGAHPSELLAELRGLLEAAEAWRETRPETDERRWSSVFARRWHET